MPGKIISRKAAYWLLLVPIETKEISLMAVPVSGPGGTIQSAHPSFEPLRLLLMATTSIETGVLDDAAKTLAASKPFGI